MSKSHYSEIELSHFMHQCNDPSVRELTWAVSSPPLLQSDTDPTFLDTQFFYDAWKERVQWLRDLDRSEDEIVRFKAYLESGSNRLGRRFERLINFWFEQHPAWSIQQSNWVISDTARTIGEFDLIALNHETGENWHIEMACKFYLSTRKTKQWKDWKGTNVFDDLQQKMDKLEKQLQLSLHPASIEQLEVKGLEIHQRALWLKGWFFHHFRDITTPKQPRMASPHCNVGWWCTQDEWQSWMNHPKGEWLELSSLAWLQPIHAIEDLPKSALTIGNQWTKEPLRKAQMVAQVIENDGKRVEVSRGFVVPNDWPGLDPSE